MLPLSRKPSFPPPPTPAPPPPYHNNRSFRLTGGDLDDLHLQLPDTAQLHSMGLAPSRVAKPSSLHPRAVSPMPVVDSDTAERNALQNRSRSAYHDQRPGLLESQSQARPASSSPNFSSPTSPPSDSSASRSAHGMKLAMVPPPSHPPPSRPPPPPPLSDPVAYPGRPTEPSANTSPPQTGQHRSMFRSFASLGLSRNTRPTTATDAAARHAAEEQSQLTAEENVRRAVQGRHIVIQSSPQDMAIDHVRSRIEALLQGRLPSDEERNTIFSTCARACESEGLDISTVLQETLIEGYPAIYWAIINRAVSAECGGVAADSLVFALLDVCRPLSPATLAAIRVACMTASDNALLQRLFRSIPPLSHISTRDALLLGPANEEDRVEVEERRNGTGSWVALIKIPRFRLRMRVCQSVSVEFIASGRIWILAFSAVVETLRDGRSENRWFLSLELGEHSPATEVNASLVVVGSSDATEDGDSEDPLSRSVLLCPPMTKLSPGRDKAIKIRLDDGPLGHQLLNESSILVDSNRALHARLSQSAVPVLALDSASIASSTSQELSPSSPEISYSVVTQHSHPSRPRNPMPVRGSQPPADSSSPPSPQKKKEEKIFVSLRKGGRYR
ncbi:hypothetical protein BC826DRAFT_1032139 [Russula brevipes]|nr:hypothetical protein BC826DRAFT_1032139 [Russula brevipes]